MDIRDRHLELLIYPRDDGGFDDVVRATVETHRPQSPRDLETALRATYPAVVVRRRENLAQVGRDELAWYVFRDGAA